MEASLLGAAGVLLGTRLMRRGRRIDLTGRTVLITGGSRGLGLALAKEFAAQGARLALCARNTDELAAAERDLRSFAEVHTFPCDLTEPDQINQMIERVEATCGPIDVLVNNAGTITVGPAGAMTVRDYQDAMNVIFWAAVHTSMALIPKMRARGGGRIVNIASVGGKMPVPHLAPYCAGKFALVGFSTALRAELARDGILITTVNPGLMRTGSPRNANFKGNRQAEYAWFSISDSLPLLSMSAARAARRIVAAAVHGDAEVTLGLPAKIGATFYGLFPALHIELSALANRLMPADENREVRPGRESESAVTRSFLRHLGRRAERKWNQLQT